MNYATIKKNDIANGPGVRVSLFVSGCRHRCKNCFNSEAWDFDYGNPYTVETAEEIIQAMDYAHIEGISYLGGEPFEPENQEELLKLSRLVKEKFPGKTIWCYTGFLYEEIAEGKVGNPEIAKALLSEIDVLVDGKFVEEEKDLSLLFRGSSNQRILDIPKSLAENKALWKEGVWQRKMGSTDIDEM